MESPGFIGKNVNRGEGGGVLGSAGARRHARSPGNQSRFCPGTNVSPGTKDEAVRTGLSVTQTSRQQTRSAPRRLAFTSGSECLTRVVFLRFYQLWTILGVFNVRSLLSRGFAEVYLLVTSRGRCGVFKRTT